MLDGADFKVTLQNRFNGFQEKDVETGYVENTLNFIDECCKAEVVGSLSCTEHYGGKQPGS